MVQKPKAQNVGKFVTTIFITNIDLQMAFTFYILLLNFKNVLTITKIYKPSC